MYYKKYYIEQKMCLQYLEKRLQVTTKQLVLNIIKNMEINKYLIEIEMMLKGSTKNKNPISKK